MNRATLFAVLVIVGFTVFMTWPQALHIGTRVASHDDPSFSMWRLAWIAHGLATDPEHLFDANIFHPAKGTLAYSDAMLLEGALAAPLFWAGVRPAAVYNFLLLGGIAASGMAMFVLARHLLGSPLPALVSAAIFTMAPYRIEHFMHLELQWTMWIPLALWAYHRAVTEASWRFALLGAIFLWLQLLSSVYYGVFLAMTLTVFVPLLLALYPRRARTAIPRIAAGILIALLLTIPYARPYLGVARSVAPRPSVEIATYSARPLDYLASPATNRLWGWTADWTGPEHRVFPGVVAVLLACAALAYRPLRPVVAYVAVAAVAIELSFGTNGRLYSWLLNHVGMLDGLRSPSRFAIVACCAIAMLAGFGFNLVTRWVSSGRARTAIAAAVFAGFAAEYANTDMVLAAAPYSEPRAYTVYKAIRALGPGVVLELPLPALDRLPGREVHYQIASIAHWQPLVNGYSGYYPPEYIETVVRLEHFPDDRSIAQLTRVGVRYLVLHQAAYSRDEYEALVIAMLKHREFRPYGTYKAFDGDADLFLFEG